VRRIGLAVLVLTLGSCCARVAFAQQPAGPQPPQLQPPEVVQVPPTSDGPEGVGDLPVGEFDPTLPFQSQLPDELIVRPPSEAVKQKYGQFVPEIIDPENVLNVIVGRPRILVLKQPPRRLYIPDEEVARWDTISETEFSIVGQQPGSTVLTIWMDDADAPGGTRVLSYLVRVLEDPEIRESIGDIERQINDAFPDSHVELTLIRNRLLVKGQAKDAVVAAQILSTLIQVRNRGRRGQDPEIRETDVFVDRDRFIDEENAALRRSLVDPTLLNRAGIVNLLEIPGEQQVMLRVTVAEINRSAMRAIGAEMLIGGDNVSFLSLPGNLPDGAFNLDNVTLGLVENAGNLLVNTGDFRLALNALRDMNLARTLAEPNLVALNGRPAQFFAGDRVPLPAATVGFGAVGQSVVFDNVGVSISFTPFIVDRDRVRLQVFGRVSSIDQTAGTTDIGGSQVSNQNARTFQTTVDLREGQTMALAGLLLNTLSTNSRKVPFLGDLPILGRMFSDDSDTYTEQELVIIVTPELVHPQESCQTPPLPGADVFQPTDVEFYLQNRLESRRRQDYRTTVRTDWHRQWQYQKYCEDRFIIGPTGHSYNCCGMPPQMKFDPATMEPGRPPLMSPGIQPAGPPAETEQVPSLQIPSPSDRSGAPDAASALQTRGGSAVVTRLPQVSQQRSSSAGRFPVRPASYLDRGPVPAAANR